MAAKRARPSKKAKAKPTKKPVAKPKARAAPKRASKTRSLASPEALARWEREVLEPFAKKSPERQKTFVTTSSAPIDRLYGPWDLADWDPAEKLGMPGEFPYTRGIHPTMYRGRLWTMRQFAGFGTAEETNQRFKYLLSQGQTGLSTAFDFCTLQGFDSDHSFSEGEVGKVGVAIDTMADMETLFDGIPLDDVTVSMTINGPAAMVWAMYLAAAEKRGFPLASLGGTIQNDILKEYQAQKMFIFPPAPSLRLVLDTFEFGSKQVPRWNTVSISGYHIREAGSTAVQELAFTLANGMTYVRMGKARGMDPDDFAPRLSFFFNSHNDLFEEVAKFRAARRIWADFMKNEIGAENPRSWLLRFHTQTAGVSCSAEQPEINIVRTAVQALAAVLGGTQSLHTNSFDEALALPTEKAVRIALRTQQILAHESGVANTIDPLGGSYFVEALTDQMEEDARKYFDRIEKIGGVVAGIEKGFFQKEIADASYRYVKEIERKDRVIVGVNEYRIPEPPPEILKIGPELEAKQLRRLRETKARRDAKRVETALNRLQAAQEKEGENLMPHLLEATRAYATLGELRAAMVEVFGEYREPSMF
ncbi:MAG TPA: methylmalonyl-CoA mutase family protein [Candidatus Thermoplasmatota archaeon]|nr:methylmalonyl-CoA mutase family protein [Candidatus Thermoplasmatota archaeon]